MVLLVGEVLGMVPGDLHGSSVSQWLSRSTSGAESGVRSSSAEGLGRTAAGHETQARARSGATVAFSCLPNVAVLTRESPSEARVSSALNEAPAARVSSKLASCKAAQGCARFWAALGFK